MELLQHLRRSATGDFLSPAGYFFWGWVFLYTLTGIFLSYREQAAESRVPFSVKQALQFSFPARTFWGPSARLDFKIILLSKYLLLYPLSLFLILGQDKLAGHVAPHVTKALSSFGNFHTPLSHGFWSESIYTLLVLFVADLGWTIQHILFHRVPWLWEFHKVHHSATELKIFTIARLHPLDVLSQGWFAGVCVGIFIGICKFVLGYSPSLVFFMNVSWAMAFFRILGIYRHSHIWITFGPVLSRIFCSPAMHQIHHSVDERHHEKNFAVVFSFWDLVFRTIYVPTSREALRFGIAADELRKYDSFWGSMLHPFLSDRILSRFAARKKAYFANQKSRAPRTQAT